MCGLSLLVVGQAVLAPGGRASRRSGPARAGARCSLVIALLLVFGFSFERIGFVPCTLALLLVLMWFVDPVVWWMAIIVAVTATARRLVRRMTAG